MIDKVCKSYIIFIRHSYPLIKLFVCYAYGKIVCDAFVGCYFDLCALQLSSLGSAAATAAAAATSAKAARQVAPSTMLSRPRALFLLHFCFGLSHSYCSFRFERSPSCTCTLSLSELCFALCGA